MDNEFDVISIGDVTMDVFLELEEASVACNIQKEDCKLLLEYAEKIPVKSVTQVAGGGNAANYAVGSARLGLKVALVSVLGEGAMGQHIKTSLEAEEVDCRWIKTDQRGTNYATILNFAGERTILSYHEHRLYEWPNLIPSRWIYYSSVPEGNIELNQKIIDFISQTNTKLAFNPGTKQIREGLDSLKPILAKTNVLFLNREEAEKLVGPHDDLMHLMKELQDFGVETVILTLGAEGARALHQAEYLEQKILPGEVVEKTGAGDAFATAVIAALTQNQSLSEALKWGTINAWSTLQQIGSHAGLLTRDQLQEALRNHSEL